MIFSPNPKTIIALLFLSVRLASGAAFGQTVTTHTIVVAKSGGDYTTVQSALDSITTSSDINRYHIKIMPGVFIEHIYIHNKNNITIEGSGRKTTVLKFHQVYPANSAATNRSVVCIDNANIIEIKNLSIINTSNDNTAGSNAIYTNGTTNGLVLENLLLDSAQGANGQGKDTLYLDSVRDGAIVRDMEIIGSYDVLSLGGRITNSDGDAACDRFYNVKVVGVYSGSYGNTGVSVVWIQDNIKTDLFNCIIDSPIYHAGYELPAITITEMTGGGAVGIYDCQLKGGSKNMLLNQSSTSTHKIIINVENTPYVDRGFSAVSLHVKNKKL